MITTEAGLPRLNMRDLRYMFARFLLEQDFSLEAVSGILGHTKQTTTLAFCNRIPCTDPEVGAVVAGSLAPVLGAGKKEGKTCEKECTLSPDAGKGNLPLWQAHFREIPW